MKNTIILAGAAALAFTAPVLAQPGKGGGGGNGNGGGKGGPAAQVQKGGGGGPQQARGGGGGPKQQQMRGGGQQREARGNGGPQMRGPERRVERQAQRPQQQQQQMKQRGPVRDARADRGPARIERGNGKGGADTQRFVQDRGGRNPVDSRVFQREQRITTTIFNSDRRDAYFASPTFRTTGLVDGCPPGLAAKGNGCLPPGQAKKLVGAAVPVALGSALLPIDYRNWYPDNDEYYYRTTDGYVYRVDRDRNYVDAYWPIADDWTGAYYVGSAYPQDYLGYYNVPVQYQTWYPDSGADDYYRYGDGAIYQVDRGGGLIEGIVSLLAGGFGVGQPMPAGYDVYNVPYAYRDRYVDNADHMYRYNDGYIYDVDPTTQIVQAIVETLV